MIHGLLLFAAAGISLSEAELVTYPFADPDPVPATSQRRHPYFAMTLPVLNDDKQCAVAVVAAVLGTAAGLVQEPVSSTNYVQKGGRPPACARVVRKTGAGVG